MVTLSAVVKHGGLEIDHWKTFGPRPKPVMDVVGESELVIVPEPDTNDHVPIPVVGVLAAMVALGTLMQMV